MIETIYFQPWVWIVAVLLGVLALISAGCAWGAWRANDPEIPAIGAILSGVACLILAGFYFGAMLPPYDSSYYQTYRITGHVTQIDAAFSGDEGTMSQVFIAKVDGVELFIKSDDQRFRTVHEGDNVNLVCGKSFAYFQEPWFECSFGGVSR